MPNGKIGFRILCQLVTVLALGASNIVAQGQDAAELTRQVQNPIARLISVPFQNNTNFGIGDDRTQNVLNIQPVLPYGLGRWSLINRGIVPIVTQPDLSQESGSTSGLGDVVYQGLFTPPSAGRVTWGFGPVLSLPTATDEVLGSEKFSAGPAVIVVAVSGKWVVGGLVYNVWSVGGESDRADVNAGSAQYFINYNLPDAWYLSTSPLITVNWEADDDNQWIVPFGGGVGKVFAIGRQRMNGQVTAYWNAVKPDALDGPDWTLRAQLSLLFPK